MPAFASSPAPQMTRWGKPVRATQRLPGIWRVVTPSHGGFVISEARQAAMPAALRLDEPEYEHDVDWSLVILAFQTDFAAAGDPLFDIELSLATSTVKSWRPERWEAYASEALERRQSHVRREREAFEARIGKLVVTTAYGDWADWVPEGKVGILGYTLVSVDHLARPTYADPMFKALVDAARYEARGSVISFDELDAEILP
ncbi:DUF7007 domain-containing protein [Novosphingobium album (ex Hu et al. 2023)]|uniref:DUF7007 domain-containing protein n=1 Tax=Novosphingobium album (ex Hu et al. 2023) TaxID=2930093 RepID=A0ABT0B548_9SPHN|nr:hypothetical protein [Novosphingobium album (ex Hu et al. 2023)]MCJ2180187.1 hypothetical protein [Novosphingobium album (ex Hu et al. 2023)]